jgi:hypothetical protein
MEELVSDLTGIKHFHSLSVEIHNFCTQDCKSLPATCRQDTATRTSAFGWRWTTCAGAPNHRSRPKSKRSTRKCALLLCNFCSLPRVLTAHTCFCFFARAASSWRRVRRARSTLTARQWKKLSLSWKRRRASPSTAPASTCTTCCWKRTATLTSFAPSTTKPCWLLGCNPLTKNGESTKITQPAQRRFFYFTSWNIKKNKNFSLKTVHWILII